MQRINLFAGKAFEQPVVKHRLRPTQAFLGRLENQDGGAVEIARLRQIPGSPKQYGCVTVMAAGMHQPRFRRAVLGLARLGDRQCIHIRTQPNHASGRMLLSPDHTDHACLADAAMHFDPERLKRTGHDA